MFKNFKVWFHGFLSACIGGGATSASSWLGMTAAKAVGLDVPTLNLESIGVIFASGAATSVFAYLKQSPIPPAADDTAFIKKEDVSALAILGLCAGLLAGCGTLPPGEDANARVRREVAGWSEDIVALILVAEPKYRPVIEQAVGALDTGLVGDGSLNLSEITSALGRLEQLQSKDSKLALIGGRLVVRRAFGNVELQTPDAIHAAGLGLRDGLKAALGQ